MIAYIVKLLSTLCGFFVKEKPILLSTSTGEISKERIREIFRAKFPDGELYISDSTGYRACNLDDINTFLEADQTDKIKYVSQKFDCDNFANRLFGQFSVPGWSDLTIGKMWTDLHACLIVIDQNEELWILEPQSDSLQPDLEAWQGSVNRWCEI